MTELSRYLHPFTDVPAGDIGVGERELGYLYGQYKRLTKKSDGVLTGKPLLLGGSDFRPEAAGFGVAYIANLAIVENGGTLKGARCAVSGSGNVAQYAAKKLLEFGARVVSFSDSNGSLIFKNGMTEADWEVVIEVRAKKCYLPVRAYSDTRVHSFNGSTLILLLSSHTGETKQES